ncbi:MAG: hypothetical protein LUE27_09965 [Clostridia bacterium]|nr:hypothetical protein [Clostridia bacterium]
MAIDEKQIIVGEKIKQQEKDFTSISSPAARAADERGLVLSRTTVALMQQVSCVRLKDVYDTTGLNEEQVRELMAMRDEDGERKIIGRNGKRVSLTSIETRTLIAISIILCRHTDDPAVQAKFANPYKAPPVTIITDVGDISSIIYGNRKKTNINTIDKAIDSLAVKKQRQEFVRDKVKSTIISPFIQTGEGRTLEKNGKVIAMREITPGTAFFLDFGDRYADAPESLFEAWRKNGRGTELFSILVADLLANRWHFTSAAKKTEKILRSKFKNLPNDELEEKVHNAKIKKLTRELNLSKLLEEMVGRQYSNNRKAKADLKEDLQNAMAGLVDAGIVIDCHLERGAKGQDKLVFVYNENYGRDEQTAEVMPEKRLLK